jgi:hypothetical protein
MLHNIGLGKVEGSQVSVSAAIALLRKALPDLQASQISVALTVVLLVGLKG